MEKDLILKFKRKEKFNEILLVLSAMNINFNIKNENGLKIIIIDKQERRKALEQIFLYRKENNFKKAEFSSRRFNYLAYYSIIIVFFSFYLFQMFERVFYKELSLLYSGSLNVSKVRSGEIHRLITALTLHSDFVHILSNAFFGGFIIYFLLKRVGVGLGWMLVLISGISGNLISSFIQREGFISIGSSTACFGGVGILGIIGFFDKEKLKLETKFTPLFASLSLLGLLGTSYESDIFGHLFGFISGLLLGLFFIFLEKKIMLQNKYIQVICGLIAIMITLSGWLVAIKNFIP